MQGFYKYTHINTNTTTTIPSVVLLGSVTVNIVGSGGNTATLYNGTTSNDVIAVIDTTKALGTFLYDVFIMNSLVTVVTAGGTPADLTIASY